MKNKLSKLLLVALLFVLVATVFVACKQQIDEEIVNAVRVYFNGDEFEIKQVLGRYDVATVVYVQSTAVDDRLQKETINGVEFNYANQTLLLAVNEGKAYSMKDAYVELFFNTSTLRAIQADYNKIGTPDNNAQYAEIGDEIVLEAKYTMEDIGYVFHGTDLFYIESDGTETQWYYYDDRVVLTIDSAFNNHYFTVQDFAMMNYRRIDFLTEYAYDKYDGNFPKNFHHTIVIELKHTGIDSVLRAIETLSKLEFVASAQVRTSAHSYKNQIEDGQYNAVLVAQPVTFSSWVTDFKVEIKNSKLFIEDDEIGELSEGKLSKDNWYDSTHYNVVEGVQLDTLMNIENCFVVKSSTDKYSIEYYLISNGNNYYLLWTLKSEDNIVILKVYLLDK